MRQSIRKLAILTMLAISATALEVRNAAAQDAGQAMEDVVYLKDGSIIRGMITEQRPGVSVLIRTRDGNTLRYTMDRIERMTKEPIVGVRQGESLQFGNTVGRKDPAVAFVLSLLIVGGGQGYNGQWGKAGAMFAGEVVGLGLMFGGVTSCDYYSCGSSSTAGIGALIFVGSALWSIIDAPMSASAINRRNQRISVGPSLQPLKLASGGTALGISVLKLRH